MLNITPYKVRRLKQKCGFSVNKPNLRTYTKIKSQYILHPNVDWRNYEWLYRMRNYGVRRLSAILNIGIKNLISIFDSFGIERSTDNIESHPCCNYEWLYYHYSDDENCLGLSANQCAKIADVSPDTIANWLIKFNIPVRALKRRNSVYKYKSNHRNVIKILKELDV